MKKYLPLLFFAIGITVMLLCAVSGANATPVHFAHSPYFHHALGGISMAGMMPGVVDTTRQRFAYDRIKYIARKLKEYGMGNLICNQDYFRSEQAIANGTTSYGFPTWQKTMDGTRATYPLQQGVADKDLFVGITMGMYLDNRVLASAQVKLQSYPSYQAFNANTGNLAALYAFFNGFITLTVDRTVYIPRVSTSDFLVIPQTQASSVQNENQFSITSTERLFDPYFLLSGQNTNTLVLNVYNTDTFTPAGTNSTQNVVTLYSRGITIQSGADFIDAFADFESWVLMQVQAGEGNANMKKDAAVLAQAQANPVAGRRSIRP